MCIFQSEPLNSDFDAKITSMIFKSYTQISIHYHVWALWGRSWEAIRNTAKTDQHCRAEDCLAIDMERFATGVRR